MVTFPFFLRLLDRYPIEVPIKGGHANWIPEVIIITCPRPPSQEFVRHVVTTNGYGTQNTDTKVYEDVA